MYKKKNEKRKNYFNKNTSNLKCPVGNSGNVSLCFFYCLTIYFLLPKTVDLMIFYCKITFHVRLDVLQLITIYNTETLTH